MYNILRHRYICMQTRIFNRTPLTMLSINVMLELFVAVIMLMIMSVQNGSSPSMDDSEMITCEEFSRFARFNPYSVLDWEWMVFYYWGPPQSPMFVRFLVPTAKQKSYMRYEMEHHLPQPINWTARSVFMKERNNVSYYLEELSDRGHYHLYELYKDIEENAVIKPIDLRFKQTGDNRYFAIMNCAEQEVMLFARTIDVPKKKEVQDVASRFGIRGRGGKSYLYQGHQWMPIEEASDEDYVEANRRIDSYTYTTK